MTAYRFRVKYDPDPTSLWRDVVVGEDRTVAEFQAAINPAFGLDQGHLWFVGTDEDYWNSDVRYVSSWEFEDSAEADAAFAEIEEMLAGTGVLPPGGLTPREETHDAGEATVGEMVQRMDLDQYDRICYLFDYGDEWRFYGILKEVLEDEPGDREPEVVKEKGDPVEQYGTPAAEAGPSDATGDPPDAAVTTLPDPLDSVLPDGAVPVADLRTLEDRDDVVHVLVLLGIETGFGTVSERFAIQFEDAGYVLEYFADHWEVVDRVDGEGKTGEELLTALARTAREWHAEIAEITQAASGISFDEHVVEDMNTGLYRELERKGYGHVVEELRRS